MNKIIKKFLVKGNKLVPEKHLRQARLANDAFKTFIKNKERIQKFKEAGGSIYIYQKRSRKRLL